MVKSRTDELDEFSERMERHQYHCYWKTRRKGTQDKGHTQAQGKNNFKMNV